MSIQITGDLHAEADISKFNTKNFPQQYNLTKNDYVIVLGDFGLVWDGSKQDKYWQKWLSDKPWTTLFVDGNHDNIDLLDNYPVEIWNGGKVHKVTDSIIHLMRGQVFTIESNTFFTFGGARSHDKIYRKEGKSWWAREIPSMEEMNEGIENLEKVDYKVDYVLTHTCPSDIVPYVGYGSEIDELERYLNHIKFRLDEKKINYKWYFGHFHKNEEVNDKFTCLYKKIIELGGKIE